mgnify:CR=1 FL=1
MATSSSVISCLGFSGTPVLNHVSATIAAGQTVALVGVTGSGKSTLISLLARLHDPPPGTVFVDGVDVREMPLATLRGAIGFVPQEPFLFSDTLADNVAFGLDAITEAGRAGRAGEAGRAGGAGTAGAGRSRSALQADGTTRPHRRRRRRRAARQGRRRLSQGLRDDGRRARHHAAPAGRSSGPALARAIVIDPRILILDDALSAGGHLHRGGDPRRACVA